MTKLERIVRFETGHNCIDFECKWGRKDCVPGEGGSHGKSGLSVRFVVKGDEGAVQFLLSLGMAPLFAPHDGIKRYVENWGADILPFDLGFHSKTPQYEGHTPMDGVCEFTDGPCYYDGSSLNAYDAMYTLVNGGEEALWKFLEAYYDCVFHDGFYPQAQEYEMPRRAG